MVRSGKEPSAGTAAPASQAPQQGTPADEVAVHYPCAFGPEGEHHGGELVLCDVCGRPTCDYCGCGHNDIEDDWLCPDCV